MELESLLKGLENYKSRGDLNINISNVESNSKKVTKDTLFIAIKGYDFDGHDYVEEAIENGATAVMLDLSADLKKIKMKPGVTAIIAENTREAMAKVACNFYGNPSQKLKVIGITGTKGKTTTTYMIKSILEKTGKKVGLIGTIANYAGDKLISESTRTTPESLELQKYFAYMVKEGIEYVVMEVSSQSLNYAIFTNLYKDHISLKEHPDIEDYFSSKVKLFENCPRGYVNLDDFRAMKLMKAAPNCKFKTYAIDNNADLLAKDITITNVSVDYKVKIGMRNERVKVNIPGRYSVYNSLAAISVCLDIGADAEKIKEALLEIVVPGRNELVPNKDELAIMIDYAHNPESLGSVLKAAKTYTKGRVICVFGCGGDRDKTKRPEMGEVAGRLADYTIVTSDNPRSEKPEDIIEQIKVGIDKTKGKYEIIVERKEAIAKAIKMMNKKDILILAGKGHEKYQEINGEKLPFDERVIIKEIFENK